MRRWSRAGRCCGLAALAVVFGCESLQNAVANGDTRSVSLHHMHTDEDITITYKRNGRYDEEALKKINWFLRDWRRQESHRMDPRLIDLAWEVSREVDAEKPIWIVCGYRAPTTNAMLRRRSRGVAKFSQHTLGRAMDFYIPGVPLDRLRNAGLRLQRGGVGYYPTSGSPFVHLDTGNIRHWPRMNREQLARVFPDGRTVHIPSDGRPLSAYALALADVERRGASPSQMSVDAARSAGVAEAAKPAHNVLAALFGSKDSEDEDEATGSASVSAHADTAAAAPEAKANRAQSLAVAAPPTRRAAAGKAGISTQAEQGATYQLAAVPMPPVRPTHPAPVGVEAAGASSFNNLITARGHWDGGPSGLKQLTGEDAQFKLAATIIPMPIAADAAAIEPVDAPERTATTAGEVTLAYASTTETFSAPAIRSAATGSSKSRAHTEVPTAIAVSARARKSPARPAEISLQPAAARTTDAVAQSFDDLWLRAMVLTPNLQNFMSATVLGTPDLKDLRSLMGKPSSALVMTFSEDPLLGIGADRFSGDAVVFLSTVTFTTRTAFLQR